MHVTQSFPSIAVFILGAALALPAGGAQVIYDIAASDQDGNIYGENERDFLGSDSAQSSQGVLVADLNGDGFGDLIAGAPKYGSEGSVYVVFGSEDMSGGFSAASGADLVVRGSKAAGSNLSGALAAGDINGDGIADLLMGAPDTDVGSENNNGAVIVIYGTESLSGEIDLATDSPDVWITAGEGDSLGQSIQVADVNGDEIQDLILGAPDADPDPDELGSRSQAGVVHVIYGSAGLSASIDLNSTPADITVSGNNENGRSSSIGERMAVGDVNGDGYSDFFFGYYHAQVEGWDSPGHSGIFWGILGSATLNSSYDVGAGEFDFKTFGTPESYGLGALVTTGDFDDDGYDELIIQITDSPHGAVAVIAGSEDFGGIGDIDVFTDSSGSYPVNQGLSGLATGDFNGDGLDDLAIGNSFASPESRSWAGATYLFAGGEDLLSGSYDATTDSDLLIQGHEAGDYFGFQIAMGDLNGDGLEDLVANSPNADKSGRSNAGRVYFFMGTTHVPEPGAAIATGSVFLALLALRRRRIRAQAVN